ncbi:MAG: metallophosphoesterase [Bacteroidia bacterium]
MLHFKIKLFGSLILFALLLDLYLWQAIKFTFHEKSNTTKIIVKLAYWSVSLFIILSLLAAAISTDFENNKMLRTIVMSSYFVIYLSKMVAFLFIVADDAKRGIKWLINFITARTKQVAMGKTFEKTQEEIDIEIEEQIDVVKITRSQFITRAGLISGTAPLIIFSRGIVGGAHNYKVHRKEIFLPNLPDAFDGLKMLQISDVHTGSFYNKDAVYKGIQLIKEQKADIAFFTGDFVNNKTDEAYEWMDFFAEVKAPMGVYSIFGNHDYGDYVLNWKTREHKAKNLEDLVTVHKNMGWHLLRNEHVVLETMNKKIGIIGVENWGNRGRFQKYGDVDKAIQNMPEVPVKILLSHDPSHFDEIVSEKHTDIDLTLSGHTHGFQFGVEMGKLKWSPSQYIYPHWAGLYKYNNQYLYVNRGFGFIGYPGRVGIMPEITVITLTNRA